MPGPIEKKSYEGIPLGTTVRRSIAETITFRLRHGNGYYGSVLGLLYQDRYPYFVPASIENPEGQNARDALATAVLLWQTVLTPAEKADYNQRAETKKGLSGYNLFVGEYVESHA